LAAFIVNLLKPLLLYILLRVFQKNSLANIYSLTPIIKQNSFKHRDIIWESQKCKSGFLKHQLTSLFRNHPNQIFETPFDQLFFQLPLNNLSTHILYYRTVEGKQV